MKREQSRVVGLTTKDSMVLVGVGIGAIYWFINTLLRVFAEQGPVATGPDQTQLYSNIIVLCLFLVFGSHVQYTINRRVKAEQALSESELKYRNILESMVEGYYEIDSQGQVLFCNESMARLLGYSRERLQGINLRRLLVKEDRERFFLRPSEIDGGTPRVFEGRVVTRSDEQRFVEASLLPLMDVRGEVIGLRGVVRDITRRKEMEAAIEESNRNIAEARTGTILSLAKLAEFRDPETGNHLERMREYVRILARELSSLPKNFDYITEEYIEDLYQSAILHDVGKVGIPDAVLLKPGPLSPEEFEIIKSHPVIGGNALDLVDAKVRGQSFLTLAREIAYGHHEKWDGNGYPKGLAGENIPASARYTALADVYDALTSKRVYKEGFSHEQARDIIVSERGRHFDPEVVDAFLARESEFLEICGRLQEEKETLFIRNQKESGHKETSHKESA